MSSASLNVLLYLVAAIFSLYLGYSLRKWRDRSVQAKLTREVETLLQEPVPRFKKGWHAGQVNWERVHSLLKKLPQDEAVVKLMNRVDEQVRLYYKQRAMHKR